MPNINLDSVSRLNKSISHSDLLKKLEVGEKIDPTLPVLTDNGIIVFSHEYF